ncbi:MAG: hypothetical protein VXW27_10025, partial [Pseudomonadota bacterium]|nr:hypothetical protein [Pseudomonadota bacterium]
MLRWGAALLSLILAFAAGLHVLFNGPLRHALAGVDACAAECSALSERADDDGAENGGAAADDDGGARRRRALRDVDGRRRRVGRLAAVRRGGRLARGGGAGRGLVPEAAPGVEAPGAVGPDLAALAQLEIGEDAADPLGRALRLGHPSGAVVQQAQVDAGELRGAPV